MALEELDNTNVSTHLGKVTGYISQYDKSLLVREPRSGNRIPLGIENDNLPFDGFDVWNAYEVSALTNRGLPVSLVLKITYSATEGEYIVESKSLKLYLNSFNMTKMGHSVGDTINNLITRVTADLTELLETEVAVYATSGVAPGSVVSKSSKCTGFKINPQLFQTLEHQHPETSITEYSESPHILKPRYSVSAKVVNMYHSALLKSNCRVTSQPDWGDIYIMIRGEKTVTSKSLLQYIVSFRDECHFHEEICETIFKRLNDLLDPEELAVLCLYTRRGGIDINPLRFKVDDFSLLDRFGTFKQPHVKHVKTDKQ